MEPLNMGVIGMGQMGSVHARHLAQLAEVRVVAVADVEGGRARVIGEAVGARVFSGHRDLIRQGDVEAVLIATPHPLHAPIAAYAARQGVHVLSEKPLAISAAAADQLVATCRARGVLLGVMFQQRSDPSWRTIKRLVDEGVLGQVYRISLVTSAYHPGAYYRAAAWRGTWQGEGGGVLMNQAPHALNLFLWIGGMPRAVQGPVATRLHAIAVEDVALAACDYGDGKVGWVYATTAEVTGADRLEIAGERGVLVWENGQLRHLTLEPPITTHLFACPDLFGQPQGVWREVAVGPAAHGHLEVVKAFARAVRARDEGLLVASGEDGRRAIELANAILLASCTRRQVTLPLNRQRYTRLLRRLQRGTATLDGRDGARLGERMVRSAGRRVVAGGGRPRGRRRPHDPRGRRVDHHLLLFGPPGAGKARLARRLTTILPAMTLAEAPETSRLPRVAGRTDAHTALVPAGPPCCDTRYLIGTGTGESDRAEPPQGGFHKNTISRTSSTSLC